MKYIKIVEIEQKPKTKVYAIFPTLHPGESLGKISWYPRWRQYAFTPEPGTAWSDDCLKEVHEFLVQLKMRRNNETR